MVLYRNQWPVNFILHFAELHIGSSIRHENTLYKKCFFKSYIVKRDLISFNCFSEYTIDKLMKVLRINTQSHIEHIEHIKHFMCHLKFILDKKLLQTTYFSCMGMLMSFVTISPTMKSISLKKNPIQP